MARSSLSSIETKTSNHWSYELMTVIQSLIARFEASDPGRKTFFPHDVTFVDIVPGELVSVLEFMKANGFFRLISMTSHEEGTGLKISFHFIHPPRRQLRIKYHERDTILHTTKMLSKNRGDNPVCFDP